MSSKLQLVPETILKRKHDLDERKAHRAAQAILNPRGNKRVFNSKTKVMKIHKPESILSKARSQRNASIRYRRVMKKGMQKRASDHKEIGSKQVLPEGMTEQDALIHTSKVNNKKLHPNSTEEKDEFLKNVEYATNSVGAKVVFVVRIRDARGMPKEVKRILNRLRLRGVNQGAFVRYDASARKQLHLVEPWVTYGILSKSMMADLIHRRGHVKLVEEETKEDNKSNTKDAKDESMDESSTSKQKKFTSTKVQRIPLSDNTIVEKAFGEQTDNEVLCVEDLVHELYTVGEHFSKINSFLWTFALSSKHSKFQKEKLNYQDGGDFGDRGEDMDELLRKMM